MSKKKNYTKRKKLLWAAVAIIIIVLLVSVVWVAFLYLWNNQWWYNTINEIDTSALNSSINVVAENSEGESIVIEDWEGEIVIPAQEGEENNLEEDAVEGETQNNVEEDTVEAKIEIEADTATENTIDTEITE